MFLCSGIEIVSNAYLHIVFNHVLRLRKLAVSVFLFCCCGDRIRCAAVEREFVMQLGSENLLCGCGARTCCVVVERELVVAAVERELGLPSQTLRKKENLLRGCRRITPRTPGGSKEGAAWCAFRRRF